MAAFNQEAETIMTQRFGKDTVIALATTENGVPSVRYVNGYYENGSFYVITHMRSYKMKQIEKIPLWQSPVNGLPHTERASIWGTLAAQETAPWQIS